MNLHEKVLSLASEISERFVPAPTSDDILSDVLIGLKRYVFSLRWKEFFRLKKIQEEKKCSLSPRSQATSFFDDEVNQWKKTDATGLNTRLGPKNKNPQPPKGTDELECFIKDIQSSSPRTRHFYHVERKCSIYDEDVRY